jgi:hypothetical protein
MYRVFTLLVVLAIFMYSAFRQSLYALYIFLKCCIPCPKAEPIFLFSIISVTQMGNTYIKKFLLVEKEIDLLLGRIVH